MSTTLLTLSRQEDTHTEDKFSYKRFCLIVYFLHGITDW